MHVDAHADINEHMFDAADGKKKGGRWNLEYDVYSSTRVPKTRYFLLPSILLVLRDPLPAPHIHKQCSGR